MEPRGSVRSAIPAAASGRRAASGLETLPPELEYFRTSEAYQVELTGSRGRWICCST